MGKERNKQERYSKQTNDNINNTINTINLI